MSHIFISYAHDDKALLERLLTWLKEHDFTENDIWYDTHIEGGNNWRDEIANALDEASVVILLLTKQSVKSLYCTYEWAYAMGQGIPLLPLAFDNVSITDIPSPLTARQFINCRETIPDFLKEQLKNLKSIPPHIKALNNQISDITSSIHTQFFILYWINDIFDSLDEITQEYMKNLFSRESQKAYDNLSQLMLDKAFVFSGRQYRFCWTLIDVLEQFSKLQIKYAGYLKKEIIPQFEKRWLPAFKYFNSKSWVTLLPQIFARAFEDDYNRLDAFAEFIKVFPQMDSIEVTEIIENAAYSWRMKKLSD